MNASKKKTPYRIILLAALLLSGMAYLLADRYLIEHVQIANVSAAVLEATITAAAPDESTVDGAEPETPLDQAAGSEPTASAEEAYTADDWHYTSDSISISIEQTTTGSGDDTVTYYVADVRIADATQLQSAFAKNMFGNNIIETTSQIAEDNQAIFAINGDYYGFRSDGIVIRNGYIFRDEPARMGLAFYRDGTMEIYDETQTTAQELLNAGVWNTLSFGPALMENGQAIEDFDVVNIDNNIGNHSIQGNNPRTGVGIIDANHFVFVVVDGRSEGYSRGVSLEEFARIFEDLGCNQAYNIDGGGSSTMYFMGRVVNNPLGRNKERGTSDILYIQ